MSGRKGAPDCPICLASLEPPKRIFQCSEGHFLCETCRRNPAMKWCPTCRGPFVGRNIGMEQVLQETVEIMATLRRAGSITQESVKQNDRTAQKMAELQDEHSSLRRKLTKVQEDFKHIESKLLKINLGRGKETPSQRMVRRPGEMMGVTAIDSSEDGGSSKDSDSDSDVTWRQPPKHSRSVVLTDEMYTLARRWGLQISKGP